MRLIKPGAIDGAIDAPPSKSMMQRAVIAAALAEGESLISNPTFCDDATATLNVVEALGARVTQKHDGVGEMEAFGAALARESEGANVRGAGAGLTRGPGGVVGCGSDSVRVRGGILAQGKGKPRQSTLDCGESGTCMRMISAVAALFGQEMTITGKGSLMKRPVGMMEEPLRMLGASCETENGKPPIRVRGPIHGGNVTVDGSVSSQFVSGLLMALPLCKEDSEVEVLDLKSSDYVFMTISVMEQFEVRVSGDTELGSKRQVFRASGGQAYKKRHMIIDGDWSGAAFMLVAGAIAGRVEVRKLGNGIQPDQKIRNAILQAGADVSFGGNVVKVAGSKLTAFEFDATDCPDLFPPLAVLACSCDGKSVIHGASRLKHKESDRASVLATELGRLGADIKVIGDRMEITGKKLAGGRINPHGDHRIAMAGAIAALNSTNGVGIEDEGCVSKSYPGFFADLESLRLKK